MRPNWRHLIAFGRAIRRRLGRFTKGYQLEFTLPGVRFGQFAAIRRIDSHSKRIKICQGINQHSTGSTCGQKTEGGQLNNPSNGPNDSRLKTDKVNANFHDLPSDRWNFHSEPDLKRSERPVKSSCFDCSEIESAGLHPSVALASQVTEKRGEKIPSQDLATAE